MLLNLSNGVPIGIADFFVLKKNSLFKLSFVKETSGNSEYWYIEQDQKARLISNEDNIVEEYHAQEPFNNPFIDSKLYYQFERLNVFPGKYYDRIYRPITVIDPEQFSFSPYTDIADLRREINRKPTFFPINKATALDGMTQLSIIIEGLKSVCRTIHPSKENLKVYGNEIRDLLILTCTEVEAQLVGIYSANTETTNKKTTTKDFVRLNPLLRLDQYASSFNLYPWLNSFEPFKAWNSDNPTESIPWFKDYHAVKHNREKEFKKSNLENLFNSVSALIVLMAAQYGKLIPFQTDLTGKFFTIDKTPQWRIEDQYLPPYKGKNWAPSKGLS